MRNSVKAMRQKLNLTKDSLAKKAKISRVHLSEIENGNAIPSIIIAHKIAKALNVKIEAIFFNNDVV